MNETKQKKKGGCLKVIGIIILIVIALGVIGNLMGGNDKKESKQDPNPQQTEQKQEEQKQEAIKVTAIEISKAFEANELKGKELYTGKLAQITGTVQSIDEMMGSKFVVLNGDKSNAANITSIQCFFNDEDSKELANLSKGQTVTIEGTIGEKSINVAVKNCKLIQ